MSYVVGASAHGSPGVSVALHLVCSQWPQPEQAPVLLEAGLHGGTLAARLDLAESPGLSTLADAIGRGDNPVLTNHAQSAGSGVLCVAASPSAVETGLGLAPVAESLGPLLRRSGQPVVVDAGLLLPDSVLAPLVGQAEAVVWFVRPVREQLLVLKNRIDECNLFVSRERSSVVLIGDGPFSQRQAELELGLAVIHTLPNAPKAAARSLGPLKPRSARRNQLVKSGQVLAEKIRNHMWSSIVELERGETFGGVLSELAPGGDNTACEPHEQELGSAAAATNDTKSAGTAGDC